MKPYYQDELVTIYHGDCREVMPRLESVDLLLTDPPYGIGVNPATARPSNYQRQKGITARDWDNETVVDLESIISIGKKQVVWGGNYYSLPPSRCWLVWHKPDAVPSMSNVELAWTNQDKNSRQISHSIAATNAERVGHPTQKPLALMKWCIKQMLPCASILDPFMGSGTTLVAAKSFGIKAIGIEREERYCKKAVKRLQQESFDFSESVQFSYYEQKDSDGKSSWLFGLSDV